MFLLFFLILKKDKKKEKKKIIKKEFISKIFKFFIPSKNLIKIDRGFIKFWKKITIAVKLLK